MKKQEISLGAKIIIVLQIIVIVIQLINLFK